MHDMFGHTHQYCNDNTDHNANSNNNDTNKDDSTNNNTDDSNDNNNTVIYKRYCSDFMVVVTAVETFGDFILYFGGPIFYIDLSNHLVETDAEIPETDPRLFPISHLSPAYFQSTKRICK